MFRKLKWQIPGEPLAVRYNWCQSPVPGSGSSRQVISSSQRPLPNNTQHSQQTDIHTPGGIRTQNLSRRAAVDLRLRSRGQWDQHSVSLCLKKLWTIKFGRLHWQSQKASLLFVCLFVWNPCRITHGWHFLSIYWYSSGTEFIVIHRNIILLHTPSLGITQGNKQVNIKLCKFRPVLNFYRMRLG